MGIKRVERKASECIYCRYIKRVIDICFSFVLLLFLLLPMLLIAVAVRCESNGRAIFRQKRMGRGGRLFVCYKFRTMYENAPENMPASKNSERAIYITRVGRFLRRTSLDELPQLLNVLKGDMSLVGPRPLICDEGEIHKKRMSRGVYSIRPGITGMAQVSGRNQLCDEEKLKRDDYYLKNVKMRLDLQIIVQTFFKVIKGDGVETDLKNE